MVLGSLRPVNSSPIHTTTNASSSNSSEKKSQYLTSRRAIVFGPSVLVASLLNFNTFSSSSPPSFHLALAQQQQLDELQQEEDRAVQLFQVSSSPGHTFSSLCSCFYGALKLIIYFVFLWNLFFPIWFLKSVIGTIDVYIFFSSSRLWSTFMTNSHLG